MKETPVSAIISVVGALFIGAAFATAFVFLALGSDKHHPEKACICDTRR
jgi:hypothetical protein